MLTQLQLIELRKQLPILSELSPRHVNLLLERASIETVEKDKLMFSQGSICRQIFIILDGSIRVFKNSSEGREVNLYRIKNGETCLMSISCIFSKEPYPAVAAVDKTTKLFVLPEDVFKILFEEVFVFQQFFFSELLLKFKKMMNTFESITFQPIEDRICNYLANQQKTTIYITHETLAQEIGTNRVVVSRVLKQLERDGVIKLTRGKIELLKTR